MIVRRLCDLPSIPAPKEWESIPEVAAAKPSKNGFALELRQLHTIGNVVVWQRRTAAFWSVASEPLVIELEGQ